MTDSVDRNVSELSQKLLEGCKLLHESCPETNVPLVATKDGRMYSVGNGCYYVHEGGALVKSGKEAASPLRPIATPIAPPTATAPTPAAAPPPAADDSASLSAMVAQKLLEGFTLLSDSCPTTNVPLVQNKQGQIFSVGTGRYYERRGDGKLAELGVAAAASPAPSSVPSSELLRAMNDAAPPAGSPLAPPYSPPPPAAASAAVADALAAAAAPPPSYSGTVSWPPASPLAAAAAAAGYAPPAAPAAAPPAGLVDATVQLLYAKLGEAKAALALAAGPDAAAPTITLIKETALAIAALRAL
jgi:uncharacterized Zn finger protein (UPF0148 family)